MTLRDYIKRQEERISILEDKISTYSEIRDENYTNTPEECLRSTLKEIQEMRDEIKSNDAYAIKLENGYDEIEKILFGNAKNRKVEEIVDKLRKSKEVERFSLNFDTVTY